jgi:hypothetical protein
MPGNSPTATPSPMCARTKSNCPADERPACLARVRSLSIISPRTRLHLEHESLVLEADADRQLVGALRLAPGQMVGIRLTTGGFFPAGRAMRGPRDNPFGGASFILAMHRAIAAAAILACSTLSVSRSSASFRSRASTPPHGCRWRGE